MQQFVVPQFIDVEDKIIGPITVRQFIILLVGAGIIFVAYKLSDFALFLIEMVIIAGLSFVFAFVRINGRPIHYLLLNITQTMRRPKIKVWQKLIIAAPTKASGKTSSLTSRTATPKHVRATRLAELSLIVDTGGIYQGEPLQDLIPSR